MKKFIIIFLAALFASLTSLAQQHNWALFQKDNNSTNTASLDLGFDYGTVSTFRYSKFIYFHLPIMLNTDFTIPAGNQAFDDFRWRLSAQTRVLDWNNFGVILKYGAVIKRYESELARHIGFGREMAISAGYFRPKWFVAGDFGYDKTSITHIKHGETYKKYFPEAKDAWYESLAGSYNYGLQGGFSLKKIDINTRFGLHYDKRFKKHTIPYYGTLGVNYRF